MDPGGLIWTCLLLVSICACVLSGNPVGTSTINCNGGGSQEVGSVDEGFTGDVELVNGITPGQSVKLVPYFYPTHLEFLELIFTLGDTTAIIRTKKPLDAEALADADLSLHYSVMCDGSADDGVIKYNNTRLLKVRDLNDNSPVFTQKLYDVTVSETQALNTEVLRVKAEDKDSTSANNRVTYSILPTPEDFSFNTAGAFILKKRLNYNLVQKYNFIVTAEDNSGLNDTASVQINVLDFDNLNPYFSHNQYQTFIHENQIGPFENIQPEAIKAQDGDTGINMTLTYSIGAVSPEKYQTNFNVDAESGVLTVATAFDREEMSSNLISLTIKAAQTDDSTKTADAVVTVTVEDVNDNAPEFNQSDYSVKVLENSPVDAVVFKAIVTDLDQGGFVGKLQITPASSPFSVSSDGTVTVKNSTALDREATESFTFQIEATETDPPNSVTRAQVNVTLLDENDNSPSFDSSEYKGNVFANQTVGTALVQVKAEDPDAGVNGEIRYSIEFGNNGGYFSIDENTGAISLAKLIPLEENKILEFPLYVKARDGGIISRSTSAQVMIQAPGNSNPQFLQKRYSGTVEEEQEPGVVITRVIFLALPSEIPVTLQVETEGDKFTISSSGELKTKVKLDFDEAPHNYTVEISISDGVSRDNAVVEVQVTDVNDNSPVFASDSVTKSVPEDTEVGSNVSVVPATDKDSSFNKEIRYSLRGGEGRFTIDPVSGMVSVAGALDRETKADYDLLVVAEDQGRPTRSATAALLVQVSDVNDNVPKFSKAKYEVEVLESELVGTSLLTLSAVDPDDGTNGTIIYSIVQQSPSSEPAVFQLNSSSGVLLLAQPLDYSEVKVYNLKVQATDGGTPSLVGNSSVMVKVKDLNNNPPEFSKKSYDVAVPENLASGASVLTLEVSDKDEGGFSNGYFLYNSDTFDINKQGVVTLKTDVTLDREMKDSYILQVTAVDQVSEGLNATAQINITVLDYNDNAPQFPTIPNPLPIPEGHYSEETPGEIFTIRPTDDDLGVNGEVVISLASPHPLFRIREDWKLLAVGDLDRESRETYDLVIKASDKGIPQRQNFTTVTVLLTDINDNRPEFSSSSYVSNVLLKDAEKGKVLLVLSATDRDAGNNSLVTYSFSSGNSPYLDLNSESGAVTLTSDLADLTEDTTLELTAMAKDHGRPPLNSTARVLVNLRLVSLVEGVAFQTSSYNFSLPENQPTGATVGTVWASSGSNIYDVAYTLKTHTDLFSIDASGEILTKTSLDREQQEWYLLEVEAEDTRIPPTSATAVVKVQVEDVNESPQFASEVYRASVFSIAPYKTPVVYVKATDPDVGDEGRLVYSLSAESPYFDVDPSSGLVYVVSTAGLAANTAALEVKATDPRGLNAVTNVEVSVQGSVSSSDVVIISLNQPANVVEKKVRELEKSLGAALGWTVNIIEVSSSNGGDADSRSLRAAARTLVSFIAVDGEEAVSSEEVTKKLQSQSAAVTEGLIKVFGEETRFDVQIKPQSPTSNQAAVIALGVLLGLSIVGLIVTVTLIIRFKRKEKNQDSDKERFNIDRAAEGYTNWSRSVSETTKEGQMRPGDEPQRTDRETNDSVRIKGNRNADTNRSCTSSL
ncbi:protocadherin Fat 4 isoform X4 [Channa argus]|uniref:protocadherin Fat 4 isoform X4 n=1 Tax=Channa argus TaxID=215402 RepID=UPI0035224BF0